MDCWVESQIVKPIKLTTSGHSALKKCFQIAGCLNLVKTVRGDYLNKVRFMDFGRVLFQ